MTKTRDQLLAVCLLDDSDLPLDRLALLFAAEHQNLPLISVEQNLDEINRLADALSADDHSISEEHLVHRYTSNPSCVVHLLFPALPKDETI